MIERYKLRVQQIKDSLVKPRILSILFYHESETKPACDDALIFKVLEPVKPEFVRVIHGNR